MTDVAGTGALPASGRYQLVRQLIHEGWKFLVVGGLGALVTIGAAVALSGLGKYVAVTIATVLGAVVTFVGNRYWTFKHRQGRGTAHETVVFFILNGVGLVIYYACIWIIQDVLGLQGKAWYTVALLLGTALGTLFRFWSYRKWVWMEQPGAATASTAVIGPPDGLEPALAASAPMGWDAADNTRARHAAGHRASAGPATARRRAGTHRRT